MAQADDSTELSFEQMLAELDRIVSAVEKGQIGLQDMMSEYEKADALIRRCRAVLADAEAKVRKLHLNDAGELDDQSA